MPTVPDCFAPLLAASFETGAAVPMALAENVLPPTCVKELSWFSLTATATKPRWLLPPFFFYPNGRDLLPAAPFR